MGTQGVLLRHDQTDVYVSNCFMLTRQLKKQEHVKFGLRPTIFSEIAGEPCMGHDRLEGEGVIPQDLTVIDC